MQSYAVFWNDPDGARYAGSICLASESADIEGGSSDGRRIVERIAFADIDAVRYERGGLCVWRRGGSPLRLGSVDRPGALRELADRLQSLLAAASSV
jgi:hypothetical protein